MELMLIILVVTVSRVGASCHDFEQLPIMNLILPLPWNFGDDEKLLPLLRWANRSMHDGRVCDSPPALYEPSSLMLRQ